MKVSIVGGGGLVGSMTAFALQGGGVASDLCLIDANNDLAQGQALDLLQGSSLSADQRIHAAPGGPVELDHQCGRIGCLERHLGGGSGPL